MSTHIHDREGAGGQGSSPRAQDWCSEAYWDICAVVKWLATICLFPERLSACKGWRPWVKWLDIVQPQFLWLFIIHVLKTAWCKFHKERQRHRGCFWGHMHTLLDFWDTRLTYAPSTEHAWGLQTWDLLKCRTQGGGSAGKELVVQT